MYLTGRIEKYIGQKIRKHIGIRPGVPGVIDDIAVPADEIAAVI